MTRARVHPPTFRATHTVHESPANVKPFDIIIKPDVFAPEDSGKFVVKDTSFCSGSAILAPGISEGVRE